MIAAVYKSDSVRVHMQAMSWPTQHGYSCANQRVIYSSGPILVYTQWSIRLLIGVDRIDANVIEFRGNDMTSNAVYELALKFKTKRVVGSVLQDPKRAAIF